MIKVRGTETFRREVNVTEYEFYRVLELDRKINDHIRITKIAMGKWLQSIGLPFNSVISGDSNWTFEAEHHTSHYHTTTEVVRKAIPEEIAIYNKWEALISLLDATKLNGL